jgi:hypothetical protein
MMIIAVAAFAVICAALIALGRALLRWLGDPDDDRPAYARMAAGGALGLGAWIAVNWLLALAHLLTRSSLAIASLLPLTALVSECLRIWRRRTRQRIEPRAQPEVDDPPQNHTRRPLLFALLIALPLIGWTGYSLWRGAVLPPDSHDALAYHLPKAVLMMKAHGFEYFSAPDERISNLPVNYELLLADVMILTGGDDLTEWTGLLSYGLFLLVAASLASRWWGSGRFIAVTILAVAATPILLLHSGAHKNDVLTNAFALGALVWGSEWCVRSSRRPFALAVTCAVMAVGTKPTTAIVAVALAPFALVALVRLFRSGSIHLRTAIAATTFILVTCVLGGSASYVASMLHRSEAASAFQSLRSVAGTANVSYGDWANIWVVPLLLLLVPFSPNSMAVWVPWRSEYWYWPHYEIFFSHYGALCSVLALLVPFCIVRYRKQGEAALRRERNIASLAAAIAFLLTLPIGARPLGMFASFPRYFLFIVPFILCWTLPPLLMEAASQPGLRAVSRLAPIAVALYFAQQAIDCAINDRFSPWVYAIEASRHPGTRLIWFMANRAGSIVDRMAGPADTIAVDGSFDTWAYPAWGAQLSRNVVFLPANPTPEDIPAGANWVMIDRSYNIAWGNAAMTNTGKFWQSVMRGKPSDDDVRLFQALQRDPRWVLVYSLRRMNQAVFRRAALR